MRVTVITIEEGGAVVLVPGSSAFGVRGSFGCHAVVGEAFFVASRGYEDNLRKGNTIEVEPGFEAVTDMTILSAGAQEWIEPVDEPADYLLRASVIAAVPGGRVRVRVRGFFFDLERDDLSQLDPQVGDALQFKIRRLFLWDREGTTPGRLL